MRIRFRPRIGPFVIDTRPAPRHAPMSSDAQLVQICLVLGVMVVIAAVLLVSLL